MQLKPTMPEFRYLMAPLFLALVALSPGCGKNSTGDDGNLSGTAAFRVKVQDDTGKALPNFTVTTVPATKSALGDSSGTALLEDIREGVYQVTVGRQGYPSFSKSAAAVPGKTADLLFTYYSRVSVNVHDDAGRPSADAVITTTPPTSEQTTDKDGVAVFLNLPGAPITFNILRNGFAHTDTTVEVNSRELSLTIPSAPPRMEILIPRLDDTYTGPNNIFFSGRGMDAEDGELPDSSLVWSSNLDGELGRGKTLTVPYLRPGYHKVTLRGTDSDHRVGEATVAFSVFDYQLDSWFPIPQGESWGYRYLTPEFWITNEDNVMEYWVLKGLTAKIESDSRRVVDLSWDAVAQTVTRHIRLTLSDSLILENGNIYIGQTIEHYREWSGAVENPYYTMDIATGYSPRYLFIKNVTDLGKEAGYESTVRAETQYVSTFYSEESTVSRESQVITTSVRIGEESVIRTDRGQFKAIAVTFRQNDSEKKWYLTRGLGIIRLEDSALNMSTVALLNSASLLRFSIPAAKISAPAMLPPSAPPRFDLKIDRRNPKDMLRLQRFLAGTCPR